MTGQNEARRRKKQIERQDELQLRGVYLANQHANAQLLELLYRYAKRSKIEVNTQLSLK